MLFSIRKKAVECFLSGHFSSRMAREMGISKNEPKKKRLQMQNERRIREICRCHMTKGTVRCSCTKRIPISFYSVFSWVCFEQNHKRKENWFVFSDFFPFSSFRSHLHALSARHPEIMQVIIFYPILFTIDEKKVHAKFSYLFYNKFITVHVYL